MNRRAFLGTAGSVAVAVGLAGCGESSGDTGDHDIGMTARKFDPASVEVPVGTTVVWKNTSSHAHTVTAYEDAIPDGADYWATGEFDGQSAAESGWLDGNEGALYQDDTYEHTFETPGIHDYFCVPHETGGMVGSVVVTEDAETDS
ncbi:plastocyanin/azurin family copper-binding protein [Halosimplex salinum]|uniref:plastocyanin/azurin family copper-binding protein n=1 Tax=Halosimplex salinum TaxID=1710538 RepID=UPI000F46468B|nr:plastocyanin/azurin family copper-binding protein [Halosimplex salinum]